MQKKLVGKTFYKTFDGYGRFKGRVTGFADGLYHAVYEDGDEEDLDLTELSALMGLRVAPKMSDRVAVASFIERSRAIRRTRVLPDTLRDALFKHLEAGDIQRAQQLCREDKSVLGRVCEASLRHRAVDRTRVKEAMEETGQVEVAALEWGTGALATVAAIAPLLGLLGTVTGMIKVFRDVAGAEFPDIALLANGIWEALLTTGAGLTVAIPTYIAYRYLVGRIDGLSRELEETSLDILDLLFPPAEDPEAPGEGD